MTDFTTSCPKCTKCWVVKVETSPTPSFCPQCRREVRWYFVRQKLRTGTVPWNQLRTIVRSGKLLPDDVIWPEGGQYGKPAPVLFPEIANPARQAANPLSTDSAQNPPYRPATSQDPIPANRAKSSSFGAPAGRTVTTFIVFMLISIVMGLARNGSKPALPKVGSAVLPRPQVYAPPASFEANHIFAAKVRDCDNEPDKPLPVWSEMNKQAYRTVIIAKEPAERARHLIYSQNHAILFAAHPTCTLLGISELQQEPAAAGNSDAIALVFGFDYINRSKKRFYMKVAFQFDSAGSLLGLAVTEDSADVPAFLAANFIVNLVKAELSYLTANALPNFRGQPTDPSRRQQAVNRITSMLYEASEPIDAKLLLELWLIARQ